MRSAGGRRPGLQQPLRSPRPQPPGSLRRRHRPGQRPPRTRSCCATPRQWPATCRTHRQGKKQRGASSFGREGEKMARFWGLGRKRKKWWPKTPARTTASGEFSHGQVPTALPRALISQKLSLEGRHKNHYSLRQNRARELIPVANLVPIYKRCESAPPGRNQQKSILMKIKNR